jgi:hypothetical protein
LRPYASAYASYFCSLADDGKYKIMKKRCDLSVCNFKRANDGDVGKVVTGESVGGNGDCHVFAMSEEMHFGEDKVCHPFIMQGSCNNLNN